MLAIAYLHCFVVVAIYLLLVPIAYCFYLLLFALAGAGDWLAHVVA